MSATKFENYRLYYNFLNGLAKELTKFYYKKLDKSFRVINKSKRKGFDPVTQADREFEKFIRLRIKRRFSNHQVIGEEFGYKKTKSDYTWVLDPIDGTRSFITGNPTWGNLISLNYKGRPVMGLANFPKLNKYYLNYSDKKAYVFEKGKKKKLSVNKKTAFAQAKISGSFLGWLSLNKQKKIPKTCFIRTDEKRKILQKLGVVKDCKVISNACAKKHLGQDYQNVPSKIMKIIV